MRNSDCLFEVIDRSLSGPLCEEKEFDLKHVAAGVARVRREYDLRFDPDRIVQNDDAMIDRLWEAAFDFLLQCGIYHTGTRRRMVFSRADVERVLDEAPQAVPFGEGEGARVLRRRGVEDARAPQVSGGPIGTPLSEDQWLPIMQSYWQEPIIDLVVPGTLTTTAGREVRSRSPLEIMAAWQEAALGREAARRAGRPGLARMGVEMAISDIGHLSSIHDGGFDPGDVHIVAMIGEMKTNNELLNKVAHSFQADGAVLGFYNPILGGLAGPAEGVAVLIVAGFIGMHLIYMPSSVESCPTHAFHFNSTDPQILRAVSAACTAVNRHTHLLTEFMTSPVSGPGTESLLDECVAMATVASVCGASRVLGVRSAVGIVANHCTGLEARFNGEVARAAAGLTREQAEEIVRQAVGCYEHLLAEKPIGISFTQAYDPESLRPRPEWLGVYERARERAAGWGLPLESSPG